MTEALEKPLTLACESCGATITVAPELRTAVCPYCAAPAVVERPPSPNRVDPHFTLAFVVTKDRAMEIAGRWVKRRRLFAPRAFGRAKVGDVRGIYLPAWLYGATAHTTYQAKIGEHYQVSRTVTSTDAQGHTTTHTETHTETEWRDLEGTHAGYLHDILVTASKGIPNDELGRVEPFDLRALRRYRPELVAGWIAEDPSVSRDASVASAREEAKAAIASELDAFMPGDTHRDLRFSTALANEDLTLVLVPVWVLAVRWREDKPPVRLLVNGQTGEAVGKVPVSPLKVLGAVALGLAVLGAVALFLMGGFR